MAANGRRTLPAEARARLGLQNGGMLRAEETVDGFILRPVDQAVAWAQEVAQKYVDHPSASSAAFATNRVADSGE